MGQTPAFRLRDHVADALSGELLPYHRMHGLLLGPLRGAVAWLDLLQRRAAVAPGTSAIWPMSLRAGALHDGAVEIRIVLDQADPPAGRLRVVPGAGRARPPATAGEIRFTGWLGLLKALYEVTGAAGPGLPGGA